MTAPASMRVDAARAALLVVDIQQKLWNVMALEDRAMCTRNVGILVELARQLKLPVVQSEQYPKGLGPTVPEIAGSLSRPDLKLRRLEKLEFSCAAAPGFDELQRELGRDQWIVTGMEAHVCVYQTVRDLSAGGATVHVPADAVISRTQENRRIGLELAAAAGGIVTSTEVVVFDALHRAGSDAFRVMSRLVR